MNDTGIPVILLIIALIAGCGCMGFSVTPKAEATTVATPVPVTTPPTPEPTVTTVVTTAVPTTEPDLYPNALKLQEGFNYSSGNTASVGTVYRYWINDTYQLFDPKETRYVTSYPAPGNKYLIIFINTVNRGTARNLPVKSSNVMVHFNGMTFFPDPTHALPMTTENVDSPPVIIRIGEIEFLHKFYGSEYVEDFGYSHGMEQAYLTPGESNAIDGYIIYEVPASLIPEKTYVEIAFNTQEAAVWKLA
jgi:hypothetical protein